MNGPDELTDAVEIIDNDLTTAPRPAVTVFMQSICRTALMNWGTTHDGAIRELEER